MSFCREVNQLSSLGLPSDYECPICLKKGGGGRSWFYHDSPNGRLHPIHRDHCIDFSLVTQTCAMCRKAIDLSSILTFRDRFSSLARQISTRYLGKNSESRICMGIVLAYLFRRRMHKVTVVAFLLFSNEERR